MREQPERDHSEVEVNSLMVVLREKEEMHDPRPACLAKMVLVEVKSADTASLATEVGRC